MLWDGANAVGWESVVAEGETFEDEIEQSGSRFELFVEENTTEKRLKEWGDDRIGEPDSLQQLHRGDFIAGGEYLFVGFRQNPKSRQSDEQFIGNGSDRVGEGLDRVPEIPEGVGDGVETTAVVNTGAGVEFLEVEGLVVEKFLGFGVGGDEDLEAAVEKEPVDDISSDAAADRV